MELSWTDKSPAERQELLLGDPSFRQLMQSHLSHALITPLTPGPSPRANTWLQKMRDGDIAAMEYDIAAARAKLRGIIDMMHTKLPRELCERVYEYIVSAHDDVTVTLRGIQYRPGGYCTYARQPVETYWQADWIGEDVHRELVEIFYRKSVFKIDPPSIDELVRFLTTNLWGLDTCPASLINNLELRIDHRLNVAGGFPPSAEKTNMAFGLLKSKVRLMFIFDVEWDWRTNLTSLLHSWPPKVFQHLYNRGIRFKVVMRVKVDGEDEERVISSGGVGGLKWESFDAMEEAMWEAVPENYYYHYPHGRPLRLKGR